jgi:hypothetical protein
MRWQVQDESQTDVLLAIVLDDDNDDNGNDCEDEE